MLGSTGELTSVPRPHSQSWSIARGGTHRKAGTGDDVAVSSIEGRVREACDTSVDALPHILIPFSIDSIASAGATCSVMSASQAWVNGPLR